MSRHATNLPDAALPRDALPRAVAARPVPSQPASANPRVPARSVATAITCIDGRVHHPVVQWMKAAYGVDDIDLITEPAPERALSQAWLKELDLKQKAGLTVQAHGSRVLAIVAHHDCAGNPARGEPQRAELRKAVRKARAWHLFDAVVGLWLNEARQVEPVEEPAAEDPHRGG